MLLRSAQDDDRPGQMERKSHHLALDIGPLSAPVCAGHGPHTIKRSRNRTLEYWSTTCSTDPGDVPGHTILLSCLAAGTLSPPLVLPSFLSRVAKLIFITAHAKDPHVPLLVVQQFLGNLGWRLLGAPLWCLSLGTRHISLRLGVAVKTGVFENAAGERRGGEGRLSLTGSGGPGWPATRTSRLGKAV